MITPLSVSLFFVHGLVLFHGRCLFLATLRNRVDNVREVDVGDTFRFLKDCYFFLRFGQCDHLLYRHSGWIDNLSRLFHNLLDL